MHESVENLAARLWTRHFSAGAERARLLAIPGELASGGEIRRRRSLGIFFRPSAPEPPLHDGCAVDDLLKNASRLWMSSAAIRG
jgi:hypothetical protein